MRSWRPPTTGATAIGSVLLPIIVVILVARFGGTDPGTSAVPEGGPEAGAADNLSLSASAKGLFPGSVRPLWVKITNPYRFAITVRQIAIRAIADPSQPACSASRYLRMTSFTGPLKVRGTSSARTRLDIKLVPGTPNVCKRAKFPLHLSASAVKS